MPAKAKVAKEAKPAKPAAKKAAPKKKKVAKPVEPVENEDEVASDEDADDEGDDADDEGADGADGEEGGTRKKGGRQRALVVVESPAKAKTIKKYLGAGFTVKASVGHVMDLPKSKMGVDVEHGFTPEYVVIRGKEKIIAEIKKAAKDVDVVYLAPDPDREGEAIAWHLAQEIRPSNEQHQARPVQRDHQARHHRGDRSSRGELDQHKFDSQQARRILDRLVGYEISPILWKKVRRGLSAGRVQSVAVRHHRRARARDRGLRAGRVLDDRVRRRGRRTRRRSASRLVKIDGKKAELAQRRRRRSARRRARRPRRSASTKVERKERRKNPLAPFITSRLQQEAARKLRFTAKKTMALAQRLYEGVELGDEGAVGLITYMRTDSTRLSDDAVTEARAYIAERYGKEYAARRADQSTRPRSRRRTRTRRSARRRWSTTPRRSAPADDGRRRQSGEAARRRGSRAALPAHLEPLRRLPDEAGGLRSDHRRHRRRALRRCAPPARS